MKRVALAAGGILALLLLVAVAIPLFIDANSFRPRLQEKLTQSLGREVKLGDLKLSLLSGSVTASDLSIADNPVYSHDPFVRATSLGVAVELWPLITSRQLHVKGLTIDHPSINLIQSANGEWNFSSLGGDAPAKPKSAPEKSSKTDLDLSVRLVKITAGRFSLGEAGARIHRPLVLQDVNVEVKDFSAAAEFPFTLSANLAGGGSIKLDGKAGPLNSTDTAATPFTVNLSADKIDLAGTGLSQNAPAIAGMISLTGSCASDGKSAQIKGKLKGEKLKLAKGAAAARRAIEFEFAANHDLRKRSGRLEQGDIRVGSAPAKLTGTYSSQGESIVLRMTLDGAKMPIPELAEMLPALAVVLPNGSSLQGGTASVKLTMDGAMDRLVTSGNLSLDNTRLVGFNMGRKMATIETLAGIKGGPDTNIDRFAAGIRVTPDGMTAENIQLIVPAIGTLDGGGFMSPSNALDFKMRATVHTSGILAVASNAPIPFTVTGTASDPVFRPDMKAVVKQQAGKAAEKAAGSLLKGLLGGGKR